MNLFDTLQERGFVHQTTDEAELREMLAGGPITGYIGYDPTADSLHVGNLVTIMMLVHLQRAGHRPIALVGGGTSRIGDPSGRSEMRQMLTPESIDANLRGIRAQLERFLRFDSSETGALMVDNAEWLVPLNYIEFLRDIGRYFAVNQMIKAKGYAERLEREQGLSFIEFNYQILQAYDYLVLNQRYGCSLQMGGADQWGNIVSGVDLVRRVEGKPAHAITVALITTASGAKMGKTAEGAVWLSAERTSAYEFFHYWRNVDDRDIEKFLALFTLKPMDEVRHLGSLEGKSVDEINAAKEELAWSVTALVHGDEAADIAREAERRLFVDSHKGGDLTNVPTTSIPAARFDDAGNLSLLDLLVEIGLMPSKKEARRKISEGAVSVDDLKVSDPRASVALSDLDGDGILVRVGKKTYRRVLVEA